MGLVSLCKNICLGKLAEYLLGAVSNDKGTCFGILTILDALKDGLLCIEGLICTLLSG